MILLAIAKKNHQNKLYKKKMAKTIDEKIIKSQFKFIVKFIINKYYKIYFAIYPFYYQFLDCYFLYYKLLIYYLY